MSAVKYLNANGKTLSTSSSPTTISRTIWGALPGQTTSAVGGGHTLYGDSLDDNFVIFSTTDEIVLPANHGDYTVTNRTWLSTYTLQAGIQNLIMNGDKQVATGNEIDNLIITQTGSATVSGGGGDDVFVVGTGAAIIVDAQGSGSDVIYGFKHGTDHVRLDGSTYMGACTGVGRCAAQGVQAVEDWRRPGATRGVPQPACEAWRPRDMVLAGFGFHDGLSRSCPTPPPRPGGPGSSPASTCSGRPAACSRATSPSKGGLQLRCALERVQEGGGGLQRRRTGPALQRNGSPLL